MNKPMDDTAPLNSTIYKTSFLIDDEDKFESFEGFSIEIPSGAEPAFSPLMEMCVIQLILLEII